MMMMWPGMESTRFVLAITIIITASHKLQGNQLVAAPYIFTVINVLFTANKKTTKEIANLGVEKSFFLLLFGLETKLLAKCEMSVLPQFCNQNTGKTNGSGGNLTLVLMSIGHHSLHNYISSHE